MKPQTRAEKRRQARYEDKIKNRTFTFDQVCQIVNATEQNKEKEFTERLKTKIKDKEREFDIMYAVAMATTLAAPPLNFRHKRVCSFVQNFFGQIDAMQKELISLDELLIEAAKVGVLLQNRGDGLEVYIDPKYKYNEGDVEK